jgi:hypothetical protein
MIKIMLNLLLLLKNKRQYWLRWNKRLKIKRKKKIIKEKKVKKEKLLKKMSLKRRELFRDLLRLFKKSKKSKIILKKIIFKIFLLFLILNKSTKI